ncbi:Uncharacterised protein [Mycobacterium tuberculosis]|nr:Uncharacterised protein [Mycobacterium tuberculosis]
MRSSTFSDGAPVIVANGSSACASKPDARRNIGSSSRGTPSSRQMTATGRGYARSAITSKPPRSAIRSSNPSTNAVMSGRSAFTTFGANALLTSLRIRVWSGGSRNRNPGGHGGFGHAPDAICRCAIVELTRLLEDDGCRSTSSQSRAVEKTVRLASGS